MRAVEELQRDVFHLLLVDHAEVQAVVYVVLAQGPAPHARHHLAPSLLSSQRSCGCTGRRGPNRRGTARTSSARPAERSRAGRAGQRRARRAEGRSSPCRAHEAREGATKSGRRRGGWITPPR